MMKTIGIVTFTTGDNFGQRLQNLALQQTLLSFKCKTFTIRKHDFRLTNRYWVKRRIKALFDKDMEAFILRHACFENFDNKFVQYYGNNISLNHIPKGLTRDFDAFIAGSDQVWNPNSDDVDDINFLTFANDAQKFSYAASLAVDYIPKEKEEEFRRRLAGYQSISLRESNLEDKIRELSKAKVCTVLDPTLLLSPEEWTQYECKPRWYMGQKYILKYFLGAEDDKQLLRIAKEKKLPVIDIMDKRSESYISGPSEFIYLIHNADYIVTDSYHGTIFSLLFKKKFALVQRKDLISSMNSRFKTLFQSLDIPFEHTSLESLVNNRILDYDGIVCDRLQIEKEKSLQYLKDIVANIKSSN